MKKFLEIAEDYRKVKNYVYDRYSGIGNLLKIYPGYTVQNEMTKTGLRTTLGLPSVYFYLAVFEALGDIKSQWTRTKNKISERIGQNENLNDDEKHYLRFLLKISNAFAAVLNGIPVELPEELQKQYEALAQENDSEKLNRYLCRQVRKNHVKLHTELARGFSISAKAYRYIDHGIYIATKENRKRVLIPLTDGNQYNSQLYIRLYPEENRLEIKVPVGVTVHKYDNYKNEVGLSVGIFTMLTTDAGNQYGEHFGEYQVEHADWLRQQMANYQNNRNVNPGRKKYTAKKRRYEERLHSYINHELNRFFKMEQPQTIYLPKLPKPQGGGINKRINNTATLWQRGYIRKRLEQKCRERSVEIIEVTAKEISRECSLCGAVGRKEKGIFICPSCGYLTEDKRNAAQNAKKRGMEEKSMR